jgi:hypothetical protein
VSAEQDHARQLLYRLMAENREHARLSEDRRIAITCVTLLASSGTLIALTLIGPGTRTLPLALWLTGIGTLGTLLCAKLYERAQFHEHRARELRARLLELAPDAGIEQAQQEAEAAHRREHPRLSSLRLNTLLIAVNALAAVLGLLYIAFTLVYL